MSENKREFRKCDFPNCPEDSEYAPVKLSDEGGEDVWLHLCQKHYDLWKFIDDLLFRARIEVNIRESRFVRK